MTVGAEPKKLAVLGGLLIVAGYLVYTNVFSGAAATPAAAPVTAPRAPQVSVRKDVPDEVAGPAPRAEGRGPEQSVSQEFRPVLRRTRQGEDRNLSSFDANLQLDLLARLQGAKIEGSGRNLFEFSSAPLPKTPEPKVVPVSKVQTVPLPPPPKAAAAKPSAPPIPLKFFGYTVGFRQGARRAFFLDGDDILIAGEGDVLKKRFRVVRIGVNSVVMEDLQYQQQQTLSIEPQVG